MNPSPRYAASLGYRSGPHRISNKLALDFYAPAWFAFQSSNLNDLLHSLAHCTICLSNNHSMIRTALVSLTHVEKIVIPTVTDRIGHTVHMFRRVWPLPTSQPRVSRVNQTTYLRSLLRISGFFLPLASSVPVHPTRMC